MRVVPGGIYLVDLQLFNAGQAGPTWLVGAFASAFPNADVFSVPEYGAEHATVKIRWRRSPGEVSEGATVSGIAEGLLLPGEAVPSGSVVGVTQVGVTLPDIESSFSDSAKLLIAGTLLAATWHFSSKIKEKHGGSGTASA